MLISFSVENFRSFRDRVELRMDASADSELPEVVRHNVPGVPATFRGMLPVVSIHGANASGKSNLIKGMRLLDSLVYMAHRFPDSVFPDSVNNPSRQINAFQLDDSASYPTTLEIVFTVSGTRWAYLLKCDGQRVHAESLSYWPDKKQVELFSRGSAVDQSKVVCQLDRVESEETGRKSPLLRPHRTAPKADPQRWHMGTAASATADQECWSWGTSFEGGETEGKALAGRTRPEVPFLSVAASWNQPQASHVLQWFMQFVVIDATQTIFRQSESVSRACDADPRFHKWLESWMRTADLGISGISIEKSNESIEGGTGTGGSGSASVQRFSPKMIHTAADGGQIQFDLQQESHGTNRLFVLALSLYRTLKAGGVLIVDELHAGLHPLLLRAIIRIFQSPQKNPKNAQLIFTTHDVSLLDNTLLRRDQIHIVEKAVSGTSDLYSLSDYAEKPRKDSPLIKYYLSGYLGGVPEPDIDALFPLPDDL